MKCVCQIFITDLLDIKDKEFALLSTLYRSASLPVQEYLQPIKQENIGDVCAGMPVGDARRVVYKTEHKSRTQGLSKLAD